MNRKDIKIALYHHPDIKRDVHSLVCRIAAIGKRSPRADGLKVIIDAENKVIDFIMKSWNIWMDTTGSWTSQDKEVNEYLKTFKQYERLWASRKNEGSPEKDWYKMQGELAEYINDYTFKQN